MLVILAGFFSGIFNTVLTEAVMEATDLPRNVASSTYSGLRFLGGAIAPAISGPVAAAFGSGVPYWAGAGALAVSLIILVAGRGALKRLL